MLRALIILFVLVQFYAHAQVPDSLELPMDSLVQMKLEKLDSLHQKAETQFKQLKNEYDSVNAIITVYQQKLQHTIDSLNQVGLPAENVMQKLDSINQLKETKLAAIQSKAEELKRKTIGRIEELELPYELKSSIEQYTGKLNSLDISLPSTEFNVPPLPLNEFTNFSLSRIKGLPAGISDLKVPQLNGELGEVMNNMKSVQQSIPETPTMELVAARVEEEAGQLVNDQFGELPNLPEAPGEEAAKEILMEEAKEEVVNHFAGKEQQLQSAMDKVGKYKQTYSDVASIKDLPKKAPNPMKGKPLIERLVPGITLQIQQRNEWWVDVNPYIGYRFNKRLTSGLGWNYRLAYNSDIGQFNSISRVYGPRAYGEYRLNKGIVPRLELECLNAPVRTPPDFSYRYRGWVWSAMVGLKKEYRISKQVRGNAQVLYNLYHPDYKSPYVDRWNLRMGFEIQLKKKSKN